MYYFPPLTLRPSRAFLTAPHTFLYPIVLRECIFPMQPSQQEHFQREIRHDDGSSLSNQYRKDVFIRKIFNPLSIRLISFRI